MISRETAIEGAAANAPQNRRPAGRLARLAREPLVHFLVLGLLLFAAYRAIQGPLPQDPKRIEISEDAIERLQLVWQTRWGRPPTREELSGLVEEQIKEEVLYREALALGLDKDDTIVRRRLAQKMEFLGEDVTALRDPSADELRAWFARNREEFEEPVRVSFRHLYFSPDRRGARAHDDAQRTLARLKAQPGERSAVQVSADPFMFQSEYVERTAQQVAQVFGVAFADALSKLPAGSWVGPVESGYGWHLVRVKETVASRMLEFEEVEPMLREAWMRERRAELQKAAYERARSRYEVVVKSSLPAGGNSGESRK